MSDTDREITLAEAWLRGTCKRHPEKVTGELSELGAKQSGVTLEQYLTWLLDRSLARNGVVELDRLLVGLLMMRKVSRPENGVW
jgi:hypothetical protein